MFMEISWTHNDTNVIEMLDDYRIVEKNVYWVK